MRFQKLEIDPFGLHKKASDCFASTLLFRREQLCLKRHFLVIVTNIYLYH